MIIVDTCVISEIAKPEPDRNVLTWFESTPEQELWLSVVTLGEIQRGAALLPKSKRRIRLEGWLEGLRAGFANRILPIDAETALTWGDLTAKAERRGRKAPAIDALIAASALRHDATLATRNLRDFEPLGVRLVNPWRATKN